jgi:hypothetical protein
MNVTRHHYGSGLLFFTLLFLSIAISENMSAQQSKTIRGKVTDHQGNPLAGSSVYLSHTSIGVTTSRSGEFHLQNLPDGKYDLVISAIGYETKIIPISSEGYPGNLVISLSLRATDLAEVVVQPSDKNGWRKFGRYFMDNFIGTTRNARHCKILNREILRFRFSEKNNRLTVKADEPINIENKILGYTVSFQLIEFTADFDANTVTYYGHPLFTDLHEPDEKNRRVIMENRRNAYYGSLMHFIRSVYSDKLKEERFTVRATVTRPNREKERVKEVLDAADSTYHRSRYKITNFSGGIVHVSTTGDTIAISQDSLRYYGKILKEQDTLTQTESLASLSEMIIKTGNFSKFLYFNNTMEVVYEGDGDSKPDRSEITLQTPKPLEIVRNGSYFSPTELIAFKHWSVYEKICNMLPLDYYPH